MKLFNRFALAACASLAFSAPVLAHDGAGTDKPDTHAEQPADAGMHKKDAKKAKPEHHNKGAKKPAGKKGKDKGEMDAPSEQQAPAGGAEDHK